MNYPFPPTYRRITEEQYGFERGRWYGDHCASVAIAKRRRTGKLLKKARKRLLAQAAEIRRLNAMLEAI